MIKMDKKNSYILGSLILIIILIIGGSALTSKGKIQEDKKTKQVLADIYLDDKLLEFSENPIIEDEKVYVNINEFAELIDVKVEFKLSDKIILKNDDKNLVINTKDNTTITESNEVFFINKINEGKKTLLPVDVISEHFGFKVSALSEKTIKIYSDKDNTKNSKDDKAQDNNVQANENDKKALEDKDSKDSKEETISPKEDKPKDISEDEVKDPNKKTAYLTFDDGPNANTPQILDILKENNVKATFFMLGSSIIEHKDITKRVSDEGHGLGVHSMTHNFDSVYASPEAFMHEMTMTNDLLKEITGKETLLLRAPYGSKPYMKQDFRDMATASGYRIWDWNVDARDSVKRNTRPEEVYNEIVNQVPSKNEAVILFHDKEHTVKALPKIIEFLKENGYEINELNKDMTPVNFWNDIR